MNSPEKYLGSPSAPSAPSALLELLPRDVATMLFRRYLNHVDLYVMLRVNRRCHSLASRHLSAMEPLRMTNSILFPQWVTIYTAMCARLGLTTGPQYNTLFRLLRFKKTSYTLALSLDTLQRAIQAESSSSRSSPVDSHPSDSEFTFSAASWEQWLDGLGIAGAKIRINTFMKYHRQMSELQLELDASGTIREVLKQALAWRNPTVKPLQQTICIAAPHGNYAGARAELFQTRPTLLQRCLAALYAQRGFTVVLASTSGAHRRPEWGPDMLPKRTRVQVDDTDTQQEAAALAETLGRRWRAEGRLQEARVSNADPGPVWKLRGGQLVLNKKGKPAASLVKACARYLRRRRVVQRIPDCDHYVFLEVRGCPLVSAVIDAMHPLLARRSSQALVELDSVAPAVFRYQFGSAVSHAALSARLGPLFCLNALPVPLATTLALETVPVEPITAEELDAESFAFLAKRNLSAVGGISRVLGLLSRYCRTPSAARLDGHRDARTVLRLSRVWSSALVALVKTSDRKIAEIGERFFCEVFRLTTDKQ